MDVVLANLAVSVTELKRDLAKVLKEADEGPVTVLNHNRPAAYLLSAGHYERLISRLEDLEDAELIRQRQSEPSIKVALDDL